MTDVNRILVPMDGSPLSWQALRISLDEYPDAAVNVLHVIDPTNPGYSYRTEFDADTEPIHGTPEWYERSGELADQLFAEVRETAGADASVDTETVIGEPGREIVRYAEDHEIDQIVIGSHGREDDERFMLGSVTETVVFRSPVRVLLVR